MLQIQTIDKRREAIALATPAKRKSELGQFMTPSVIATFMAGMFDSMRNKEIRLLDAGAGIGSLTAAFVSVNSVRAIGALAVALKSVWTSTSR